MRWSCAGSRGFDGAHDGALHEFDLEVVVPAPLRALGGERRRRAERRRIEARSGQGRLDLGTRQGLVPTPPRATRACRMRPPSISSATAADTTANSKEARSRTLR